MQEGKMRIKVLFENKKGSSTLLEDNLELIKDLIQRYPNAMWRKFKSKRGTGYELDV